MRFRPTLLAAAVAATPLAVRAQPLPFTSAPATYAVTGCGSSLFPGALPSVCGRGTATVGTVVSSFGFPSYQVLLDVALEREPGFTAPFRFESSVVRFDYFNLRANAPASGSVQEFSPQRVTFTETSLTAWALLGFPAGDAAPGSLVLTGGNLRISYPESVPGIPPAIVTVPFTFTATPEPSTFALGAIGGLALAGARARSRRRTT